MMISARRRFSGESGQSTTELALMMPIIFALFFWAFQVNIIMMGYHQVAYASFMAARSFEVQHDEPSHPQHVLQMILTGQIYQNNENGPPSISVGTKRKDTKWDQPDGVKISMPQFASLPYARGLLNFESSVPTHLGPDEWDKNLWPDKKRDQETDGKACEVTDNNVRDQDC